MDWSYELLSQAEREVLRPALGLRRRLHPARSGGVCVGADEAKALDLVGRLVERSLVVADLREGETRYRLLETVRQYASERLAEAGEADETRRAHAVTFVRVAVEGSLGGEDGLSRLAVEHDNVLAALEWSLSAGDESGPELACAYGRFWLWRGQFQEARPWLERALSAHRQRDELRAELLGLLGAVLHESGDLARADEALSEGLQLARGCANRALEARLLIRQAAVRVFLGVIGFRQALGICEEAAAVLESAGDFAALADAWVEIGTFHYWLGQTSSDQAALERGAAYARRSGNRAAELLAQESLARSFANLTVPTDLAIERQEQLLEVGEGGASFRGARAAPPCADVRIRRSVRRGAVGDQAMPSDRSRVRREARLGLYRHRRGSDRADGRRSSGRRTRASGGVRDAPGHATHRLPGDGGPSPR